MWPLALCHMLGLLMENKVDKVPVPAHSGQESEQSTTKSPKEILPQKK